MPKMRYLILALTLLFFVLGSVRFLPAKAQTPAWTTYEDYDPLVMAGYGAGEWQSVADGNALGGQLTQTSTANATLNLRFEITSSEGGYALVFAKTPTGGEYEVHLSGTAYGPFSSYASTPTYGQETSHLSLPTGQYALSVKVLSGSFSLEAVRIQGGSLVSINSNLTLAFEDNFELFRDLDWIYGHHQLVQSTEGTALRIQDNQPALLIYGGFMNYIVEAEIQVQSGAAQFTFGHNPPDPNEYRITLDANGEVALYYNTSLLDSASGSVGNEWRNLRVSVVDGVITVELEDTVLFSVQPTTLLIPGAFEFEVAAPNSSFQIDNFAIWTQGEPIALPNIGAPTQSVMSALGLLSQESRNIVYYYEYLPDFDGGAPDPVGSYIERNWGMYSLDPTLPMPQGGIPTRLWRNDTSDWIAELSLSPDTTKIVYTYWDYETTTVSLRLMDSNGANQQTIVELGNLGGLSNPAWSPDGRLIAYVTGGFGYDGVVLHFVDQNGTEKKSFNLPGRVGNIDWSPNGTKIAMILSEQHGEMNVYEVDVTTGSYTSITNGGQWNTLYREPVWSPDGTKLAVHISQNTGTQYVGSIYTMDVEGTLENLIVQNSATRSYSNPQWSPEGDKIAYTETAYGWLDIYTSSSSGGSQQLLTSYIDGYILDFSWGTNITDLNRLYTFLKEKLFLLTYSYDVAQTPEKLAEAIDERESYTESWEKSFELPPLIANTDWEDLLINYSDEEVEALVDTIIDNEIPFYGAWELVEIENLIRIFTDVDTFVNNAEMDGVAFVHDELEGEKWGLPNVETGYFGAYYVLSSDYFPVIAYISTADDFAPDMTSERWIVHELAHHYDITIFDSRLSAEFDDEWGWGEDGITYPTGIGYASHDAGFASSYPTIPKRQQVWEDFAEVFTAAFYYFFRAGGGQAGLDYLDTHPFDIRLFVPDAIRRCTIETSFNNTIAWPYGIDPNAEDYYPTACEEVEAMQENN